MALPLCMNNLNHKTKLTLYFLLCVKGFVVHQFRYKNKISDNACIHEVRLDCQKAKDILIFVTIVHFSANFAPVDGYVHIYKYKLLFVFMEIY